MSQIAQIERVGADPDCADLVQLATPDLLHFRGAGGCAGTKKDARSNFRGRTGLGA